MTRTTRSPITFKRPFRLAGIDDVLPAGTYPVETEAEPLKRKRSPNPTFLAFP